MSSMRLLNHASTAATCQPAELSSAATAGLFTSLWLYRLLHGLSGEMGSRTALDSKPYRTGSLALPASTGGRSC